MRRLVKFLAPGCLVQGPPKVYPLILVGLYMVRGFPQLVVPFWGVPTVRSILGCAAIPYFLETTLYDKRLEDIHSATKHPKPSNLKPEPYLNPKTYTLKPRH